MPRANAAARSWTRWPRDTFCRARSTGCGTSDNSPLPQLFHLKFDDGLPAAAPLPISRALMTPALADTYVALNRSANKKTDLLKGRTIINLFFEASTRTQSSFELAGKRLGADVLNMAVKTSSVSKGETLIDTATTLNAMRPDILVVRHQDSGAAELLSRKLDCSVVNAGDGAHEHPTQALLDALTIKRRRGGFENLIVAICGDILHSRVARSNIHLLAMLGARIRLIAPRTLLPAEADRF